jgi:hypothetical protein
MQAPDTSGSPPATDWRGTLTALAVAMAGTVLGTIIPSLFGEGENGRLVGMLVGGLIVALISVAGPWGQTRAMFGVIGALVAILLTYSGGRAADPKLFPPPDTIRDAITGGPDGGGSNGGVTIRSGGVGMTVDKGTLTCDDPPVCGSLTITSVGTSPLQLHDIAFEAGPNPGDFRDSGECDGRGPLASDEKCTFAVEFHPAVHDGSQRAGTLVIHQNVGDEIARVQVSGTADVIDDLGVTSDVECSYADGSLVIAFAIVHSGGIPDDFEATAQRTDVLEQPVVRHLLVEGGPPHALAVPITLPAEPQITLSVNPGVDEQDPANNTLRVAVSPVTAEGPVPCGPA